MCSQHQGYNYIIPKLVCLIPVYLLHAIEYVDINIIIYFVYFVFNKQLKSLKVVTVA